MVGIEVAGHADGHVVGHIVALEVVFDVGDGGVFQMFSESDGALGAVGMGGEELGEEGLKHFVLVFGESDVVFFVDGFQLGVESSDHHVLESVGLYLGPVVELVGGYVFHIAGYVVAGVGVGSF